MTRLVCDIYWFTYSVIVIVVVIVVVVVVVVTGVRTRLVIGIIILTFHLEFCIS